MRIGLSCLSERHRVHGERPSSTGAPHVGHFVPAVSVRFVALSRRFT
jgi:hypothetical protein